VRVLAIDPGLTRCGYAVVEGGRGGLTALVYGVVRTASGADLPDRLAAVADMVEQQIAAHAPEVVAVERVFSQHNVRTVMGTAQASAVAVLAAARAGLPVALHTPSEVKAAVTGSGRADKAQVTTMITKVLRLDHAPKPADVADALALAVCHLWRAPTQARLAAAVRASRTGAAGAAGADPAGADPARAAGAWGGALRLDAAARLAAKGVRR
jgi:crossover junction endodeoxyribonuclease RuvC